MPMRSPTLKASLRLAAVLALLLVLNHRYGRHLIEALLPLLRWELGWLDDNYHILKLMVATNPRGGSMIQLDVTLARYVVIGTRVLEPNPGVTEMASTVTGTVLRPLILGLAMLAVWPVSRTRQYAWRFAIGMSLLLLILPFDVAFMLLGQLQEVLLFYAKTHEDFSALIAWKEISTTAQSAQIARRVLWCLLMLIDGNVTTELARSFHLRLIGMPPP